MFHNEYRLPKHVRTLTKHTTQASYADLTYRSNRYMRCSFPCALTLYMTNIRAWIYYIFVCTYVGMTWVYIYVSMISESILRP